LQSRHEQVPVFTVFLLKSYAKAALIAPVNTTAILAAKIIFFIKIFLLLMKFLPNLRDVNGLANLWRPKYLGHIRADKELFLYKKNRFSENFDAIQSVSDRNGLDGSSHAQRALTEKRITTAGTAIIVRSTSPAIATCSAFTVATAQFLFLLFLKYTKTRMHMQGKKINE
jgi:hypothetical protein